MLHSVVPGCLGTSFEVCSEGFALSANPPRAFTCGTFKLDGPGILEVLFIGGCCSIVTLITVQ